MNAFSPIEIHFRRRCQLLRVLYPLTLLLAALALLQLEMAPERQLLLVGSYLLCGLAVVVIELKAQAPDRLTGLYWDVEHKSMAVRTLSGRWVTVTRIHQRLSLPGILQVLVLQRADRVLPSWLLLTPACLNRTEARRLHVAMRFAAPLGSNPATEN